MKNKLDTTCLAALLLIASFSAQSQSLGDVIVNGGDITMTTAGPGEGSVSGTDALWIDDLEGGLALTPYSLGADAYEGSAFSKSFTSGAGSTFSFNWTLSTDAFDAGFADRAFAVINGTVVTLGSVAPGVVSGLFSHTFATGGPRTISFGVVDVNDVAGNSRLSVSHMSVTAVPEPETYALLLAGLGLMAAAAARKRRS